MIKVELTPLELIALESTALAARYELSKKIEDNNHDPGMEFLLKELDSARFKITQAINNKIEERKKC